MRLLTNLRTIGAPIIVNKKANKRGVKKSCENFKIVSTIQAQVTNNKIDKPKRTLGFSEDISLYLWYASKKTIF